MSTEDRLSKIIDVCEGEVSLVINEHRTYYKTIEEALSDIEFSMEMAAQDKDNPERIPQEKRDRMVDAERIVELSFYPDTPVGHYSVYDSSIEHVLDEAIKILTEEGKLW